MNHRQKERLKRFFPYVGLGILALATVILLVVLAGSPEWGGSIMNYKR